MVVADRIFFEPTEVPTLLLWSSEGPHTGVTQFIDPARQLDAVFRGGVQLETIEARHITLMQGKRSCQMADIVENAISTPPSPPDLVDPVPDRQSTSIRIAAPVFARPGQTLSVSVTIKNTSAYDWPPTGESGLHLALRWVNIDGHIRVQRAASAPLPMGLASGQSTTLTVDVPFPEKRLPLMLLADMVEDGVCWFHWASGRPTRRLVLPNPF